MNLLTYKGYTGSIDCFPEDGILAGTVLGLKNSVITYEGRTLPELQQDFQTAVDDYLAVCAENGRQPEPPAAYSVTVEFTPIPKPVAGRSRKARNLVPA